MKRVRAVWVRVPRDVWAVLCLAFLVALFFWRFLTPKAVDRVAFPGGDFTDQFYAWRLYEGRELVAGRLPVWNPYYNSGHPFLADAQAAVFYPIGLVTAWLGSMAGDLSVAAVQLEAFLHIALAGIFTYLFVLRLLRRGRAKNDRAARSGAFLAAVTFAFGGYLTSYPPLQLAILETVTWLPLFLLALDSAAERLNARSLAAAAAVLAVTISAGHTQTLLFVVYAGAFYFTFRSWALRQASGESGSGPRFLAVRLLAFGAVVGLGAALAAVQLLPALEYASLSTRSGLGFTESATGMPPLQLVQVLVPGSVSAFASPLYVGILPLWLALAALAARRDRHVAVWAGLAVLALLDMMGGFSFFYSLVYLAAPGFGLFRGQERAACLFSFALAVLAGYGADALARSLPRSAKRPLVPLFRLLAWAPLAGLLLTLFFFYATKTVSNPGAFVFLVDRAALMTLLAVMAAAAVAARLWGWIGSRTAAVLFIALAVFDLFTINWYNDQAPVRERFPATALTTAITADAGLGRVDADALPGHAGVVYGFQDIKGISPLRLRWYDDLVRSLPQKRLWSLLGVRYVVSEGPGPEGAVALGAQDGATLYGLEGSLPRAWLVTEARIEPDSSAALAALASAGLDLRRTVILDREPAQRPAGGIAGSARVAAYASDRVVIETVSAESAILVVSENYYPGWQATLDGTPVEILRADHALWAVAVPAGAHVVEIKYESLSLGAGAAISLASIILLLIVVARGRLPARVGGAAA